MFAGVEEVDEQLEKVCECIVDLMYFIITWNNYSTNNLTIFPINKHIYEEGLYYLNNFKRYYQYY